MIDGVGTETAPQAARGIEDLVRDILMRVDAALQMPEVRVALVTIAVLGALVFAIALVRASRRRRALEIEDEKRRADDRAREIKAAQDAQFAEIKGRLAAMGELTLQRQADQARGFDERLDHVTQRLNERMETLSRHLAQSLETTSMRTSESLSTLNERLAVIADAKQTLSELSSEVVSLQGVLSNKQTRGAFGQMQMEAIIRDGLAPGSYTFQATLSNGKRPDCLLRLPNTPQGLVIDSKFPLEGFEALRLARAPDEVKAASVAVREAVGRHIDDIAEKYLIPGETQDTALMFVPSESVYADLHEHFSDLVQRAHRSRVVIVAPNILMLAVQTVQAVIKDAKMRDQAGLIQKEVGLLIGDVHRLVERVAELERHFGLSQKALEKVTHSAGGITKRGERLVTLDLDDAMGDDRRQISNGRAG